MVSHSGSVGYTMMRKTADLTVVHKEGQTQKVIAKEAVHRELYPSTFTQSRVEGKSVVEKDAQATEITAAWRGCEAKDIQGFEGDSQEVD